MSRGSCAGHFCECNCRFSTITLWRIYGATVFTITRNRCRVESQLQVTTTSKTRKLRKLESMRWFSHRRRNGGRQLHYLFTDGCGGVAHCHANIRLLIFCISDSANHHILGRGDPGVGPMTPRFELRRDFCTVHLTAKFHHPTFNRSDVIVVTNKQTPLHENVHLAPLCYASG